MKASNGFNLYIDISTACNAACPFCIAPTIGRKDGSRFFDGVEFALSFTEQIGGSVQVVGGEPLISHRFVPLLREIGKRSFSRVVVNTNGSFVTQAIVSEMKLNGVTDVNVSRHHYDDLANQVIMRIRPAISNETFTKNLDCILQSGLNLRMQCNLIRGSIDSVSEMLKYITWCNALGCNEVSFSQLFPLSLFDYQVPIEIGYTEAKQIDLRHLVSEIDSCSEISPLTDDQLCDLLTVSSIWGRLTWGSAPLDGENSGKRRFWYAPNATMFSIKTLSGYDANGLPNPTEYDKDDDWELRDDVLAFAVLHSDGLVTSSWDRRERVIFSPVLQKESLCVA